MTDPLVQDRKPLNEVKYAGRDYQTIFDALLRRLKVEYADIYNDYADSSVGIMLIDLCAYAAGLLSWYLDRTVSDCYLATVRTSTAASRLTRALGYKISPAAASSADETLTFPNGIPGVGTLKAGWRFLGPGGLQFESVADQVLGVQPVGYTMTLALRQGETRTLNFVGDGTALQQYRLDYATDGKSIADLSVRVWVDGAEWTENPFITYEATSQFEVDYYASPPLLRFGSGEAGLIPADGADIRVQFIKIVGAAGNVKANTITTVLDVLTIGGVPVTFTATNPLGARSGRDAEDIDHAKKWAPYAFAARGGAVTAQDYRALSNSYVDPLYGAVAQAQAYTPRTAYSDPVFDGYINAITVAVANYVATLAAADVALTADVVAIQAELAAITAAQAIMEAIRVTLANGLAAVLVNASTLKGGLLASAGNFTAVAAAHTEAQDQLDLLDAYVDANLPLGATRTQIEAYIAAIRAQVIVAAGATTSAHTADLTAIGQVESLVEMPLAALQPLLVTGSGGNLEDELTAVGTAIAATGVPIADMAWQIATLIASGGAMQTLVVNNLMAIDLRIGEVFDNSCRSNVVQVAILSVDPDGDYVAPPSGLMGNLQAYLDGYKETTQYVEVIDGSTSMVDANITVEYHVLEGYVQAEVAAAIDTTVRGLLRGREFGDPLYQSDVYNYVRQCSDGIDHINLTLAGTAADGKGNLVPNDTEVLVLGTLTLTEV